MTHDEDDDTQVQADLVKRLRDTASKGVSVWGDLQMEAAREIEILTAERECYASAMDRLLAAQRPWVGLTDEEIAEVAERMEATDAASSFWRDFARAIEAAHNIKEGT